VSEWVEFYVPLDTLIGHFRDDSFLEISCTSTDNLKQTSENTLKTQKKHTQNEQTDPR